MANRTIHIEVLTASEERGNRGTFIGPPPHVKVDVGDEVTFDVRPTGSSFLVVFVGLSPFEEDEFTNDEPTDTVKFPGHYHYQVSVTLPDGGIFRITSCPEIEA